MLLSLLFLVGLAIACPDDEFRARGSHARAHVHSKRIYPPTTLTPPSNPLTWGDFNVIHTTDTHGWLFGHQKTDWPEPNYSGDLGDFTSFVTHMKQIAIQKDVDLLLVDSGDVHDGTGYSDGYPRGGVDAHESNKFLERLPYDLMTIGNHELYHYANTFDMYTNSIPNLNGRYLSSNVNITILDSDGETVSVPVGNRFVTFTTRKGRKVTSLGVLYDFKGNDVNTTVQAVADMVQEQWFADAIADEPDVFVLVGHMPVSRDNWPVVFNAIRSVHANTPIMIFGGHSHVRDCQQYDGRSMALESGRYMETIGWMSADLDSAVGNTNDVPFTRRYLDQNRVTYEYHTQTSNSTFDTDDGRNITSGLQQLAVDFDLAHLFGNAPSTYTMNQDKYPSSSNVVALYIAEAAPVALAINNSRAGTPNIVIINSGELRYNVFAGPFTKNDQLTAVPFADAFNYIPNVPLGIANQVLPTLNHKGKSERAELEQELWHREHVEQRYRDWVADMWERQAQTSDDTDLTPGYVTKDHCPGQGDDTPHEALHNHRVPAYVASNPPDMSDDTEIYLVFVSFIQDEVLRALNDLQSSGTRHARDMRRAARYTSGDVSIYSATLANEVLGVYAQAKWN